MTKTEIKKATDNEIIYEYIIAYHRLIKAYNSNRGIKGAEKDMTNLGAEMLSRGLLTEEQIKKLEA